METVYQYKRTTLARQVEKGMGNIQKLKQCRGKKAARKFLEGYMTSSSLHGFKYIADPLLWKSLFWTCIMVASIVFCAIFIKVQMSKFKENVLTTTISSTADPVWSIPFPAITICNNIIVSKSGAREIKLLLQENGLETEYIDNYFQDLRGLITYDLVNGNSSSYRNISSTLDSMGYNSDRVMYEVALPCEKQFISCQWKMKIVDCADLFSIVKTNRGYCCSFNAFGSTTYRRTSNGNVSNTVNFVGSAGESSGLIVKMSILRDENISSISLMHGYEVCVHDGQDFPDLSLFSKTIPPHTSQTISLTPSTLDSNPSVKAISPSARGCIFDDEYDLAWSDKYNFQTCLHECKAEIIYLHCKCIPYYYPNRDLRICSLEDVECLKQHRKSFNNVVMAHDNNKATYNLIRQHLGDVTECDCLPDCDGVRYEMESNVVFGNKILDENTSILKVHYSTISCIRYSKNVYFTWDMFVAAIGGIFGLCLGGSIISIIELFYYIITYWTCRQSTPNVISVKQAKPLDNNGVGIKVLYPVFEYTP